MQQLRGTALRMGSRGNKVELLQEMLDELGYDPGYITGIFGPQTEAAVLAFQDDCGLTTDGVVDDDDMQALNATFEDEEDDFDYDDDDQW